MRRWLTLFAVFATLLAGTLSSVAAQDDATPEAEDEATSAVIYGSDGLPEGEVEVSAIADPYEDFDASSAPRRGFHFVMIDVTITATADHPLEANSYGFSLIDTDGFLYTVTYVYRSVEATEAQPDFLGGTIEPGQSMSGAVFFEVLDGPATGLIIYQPSYERLITAADLRDEAVAEGDPVTFIAADGSPAAEITIDSIVSPLQDAGTPPNRGFEYLGIVVTIENSGSQPLEVNPYDFAITDAEGFVYNSYGVFRTEEGEASEPSLQYGTILEAGDSISGLISFEVLSGTELGLIYYMPSSDRHVRLAEYGDGRAPKPSDELPPLTRSNPGEDETPEAEATTEVVARTPGCEGVIEWATASLPNITNWTLAFVTVAAVADGGEIDAATARAAADAAAEIADVQQDIDDVPGPAEDAQDVLVNLYMDTAEALDELADALEDGDSAAVADAAAKIEEIGHVADEGTEMDTVFNELSEACPEIESVE